MPEEDKFIGMYKKLLMGCFNCNKETLHRAMNLLKSAEETFGKESFEYALEFIIRSVKDGMIDPVKDVIYYTVSSVLQSKLEEENLADEFYDGILERDFKDPHLQFSLNDLKDLEMSEELKKEVIEKLNTFLAGAKDK